VKQKQALLRSNLSGIAGWEGGEMSLRGDSVPMLSPHPDDISEPLPDASENPDPVERDHSLNSMWLLSNSR